VTEARVTTDDVTALLDSCLLLRSAYIHYHELFEPRNPHGAIFNATAPFFFGDINRILIMYIVLEVCKLADPSRDSRGNENLSIGFFVNHVDLHTQTVEFSALNNRATNIRAFVKKLKPARDKLISHTDRATTLSGLRGLGGAGWAEWDEFWLNLNAFLDILVHHYFGASARHFILSPSSDAARVVEILRTAAADQ
jgi:hypothetical protein